MLKSCTCMCQKLAKDKQLKLQLQINQNLTKIYYAYIKTLFICIVYTSTGYKSEINVHNKFCLPKSKYSVFCFQSCVMLQKKIISTSTKGSVNKQYAIKKKNVINLLHRSISKLICSYVFCSQSATRTLLVLYL